MAPPATSTRLCCSGTKIISGSMKMAHQRPTVTNANLMTWSVVAKPKVSGFSNIHTCSASSTAPPRYPSEKPSDETKL